MSGATLEIRYVDAQVQAMARRLGAALGRVHFQPLMELVGQQVLSTTMLRFERGKGPGGAAWPLSRRAQQISGQTLVATGRLRDSLAQDGPVATAQSVEIGTNLEYAAIHQFGGATAAHVIEAKRGKALNIPGIGFRRRVKHPGSTIPARPFLGLDDTDESLIRDLTDKWLKQSLGRIL